MPAGYWALIERRYRRSMSLYFVILGRCEIRPLVLLRYIPFARV